MTREYCSYAHELELVREATRVFNAVSKSYRAMEIGDNEFLAAKAIYDKAEKRFDAAFAEKQES